MGFRDYLKDFIKTDEFLEMKEALKIELEEDKLDDLLTERLNIEKNYSIEEARKILHLPNINLIKQCDTEEKLEKVFSDYGITTFETKIEYLRLASSTKTFNFFPGNYSLENKYKSILAMFLDEEFRFLKNIF